MRWLGGVPADRAWQAALPGTPPGAGPAPACTGARRANTGRLWDRAGLRHRLHRNLRAACTSPDSCLCSWLRRLLTAGIQRSSTHLSLLALYALGGHLVNSRLLPVGVLVTAIGFTFSLVFATQVGGPATHAAWTSCPAHAVLTGGGERVCAPALILFCKVHVCLLGVGPSLSGSVGVSAVHRCHRHPGMTTRPA